MAGRRTILAIAIAALTMMTGQAFSAAPRYTRTVEGYRVPAVHVITQNGDRVPFQEFLETDKTIMLDFIYTTCTTICPVLSAGFINFQHEMGTEANDVHLVSVSIDPTYDHPEVMRAYLERYEALPGWDFVTGRLADIEQVMKSFDAYVPNKMSHYPLTLLRAPGEKQWIRIYGLIGTGELIEEYRKLVKKK